MADVHVGTNVDALIEDHKQVIIKQLATVREHLDNLSAALSDSEIETRGIGVGWVDNVMRPMEAVHHHVIAVDALARVRVYPKSK